MAPIRVSSRHSLAARSARNPRGIYAPPLAADSMHTTSAVTSSEAGTKADIGEDSGAGAFADLKSNKKDKRTLRHASLLAKARESSRVSKSGGSGTLNRKGNRLLMREGSGSVKCRRADLKTKRRRPKRTLEGGSLKLLGDALPAVDVDGAGAGASTEEDEDWEGLEDANEDAETGAEQASGSGTAVPKGLRKATRESRKPAAGRVEKKIVMKSLRLRPGAQKRKRVMEDKERERFGRNLAEMAGSLPLQLEPRISEAKGTGKGEGKQSVTEVASEADRWAALPRSIGKTMERSEAFSAKA
ncbi:hypothetical protein LTR01_007494 [Friedmanniomyces endolithicus]|nr:hypothetical protein LTR01_007494 [Friedmanniomyces endolithicus]KAK0833591.1 hypothetical protein LTR73_001354 [Friedmanniomyces endolithicus]